MALDDMVSEITKTMVIGDVHVPYQDDNALAIAYKYVQEYKPDNLVINGDVVDFYNLSVFDKNPERKTSVQTELDMGYDVLKAFRKAAGKNCKLYFLEGNHENRLQRYLWRNPELEGLRDLKLEKLLKLKELGIEYLGVSGDYWKKDNGHLNIGDALIMHGDNRLNGASTSKYSGYSAKNTVATLQKSVLMNHIHRLALVKHTSPNGTLTGAECGCMCQPTGTANWQQGFVTFETMGGKNVNYKIHEISDGKMYEDGYIYSVED